MKYLHIASHEINVGDGALNSVIQSYFPCEFEKLDIHSAEKYIWENGYKDKFGKVVIGGGGALSHGGIYSDHPISFKIRAEMITEKMAFVALGYNNFYRQEYKPVQVRNLKAILKRCELLGVPFSVRDDGSKEAIQEITGIEVEAVPDPGLFVKVDESFESTCVEKGRMNVVIQLAGDNLSVRFVNQQEFDRFITEVVRFSVMLIERYDANIILAPHIFRDLEMCARFYAIYDSILPMGRKNLRMAPIVGPDSYARYFNIYKDADLVLGMRGHSVICGVGLGTKTIGIDTHPKVAGFYKKINMADWLFKPSEFYADCAAEYIDKDFVPAIGGAKKVLDSFMEKVVGSR